MDPAASLLDHVSPGIGASTLAVRVRSNSVSCKGEDIECPVTSKSTNANTLSIPFERKEI
jgi:hypothetical protein